MPRSPSQACWTGAVIAIMPKTMKNSHTSSPMSAAWIPCVASAATSMLRRCGRSRRGPGACSRPSAAPAIGVPAQDARSCSTGWSGRSVVICSCVRSMVTSTPSRSSRPLLAHSNGPSRLPATCHISVLMNSTIITISSRGSALVATTYRSPGAAHGLPDGPADHGQHGEAGDHVDHAEQDELRQKCRGHRTPGDRLAVDLLADLQQLGERTGRHESQQHRPTDAVGGREPVAAPVLRPQTDPEQQRAGEHHSHDRPYPATGVDRGRERPEQLQRDHHHHRRQRPRPHVLTGVVPVDELRQAVAREPGLGAPDGIHEVNGSGRSTLGGWCRCSGGFMGPSNRGRGGLQVRGIGSPVSGWPCVRAGLTERNDLCQPRIRYRCP